jgi:hypothetical protein
MLNLEKPLVSSTEDKSMYNKDGQVNSPEIAHDMANVEDKYHKKRKFGLVNFKAKKETIKKGERRAEEEGEYIFERKEENKKRDKIAQDIIEKEESLEEIEEKVENFFLKKIDYQIKNRDKMNETVERIIDAEFDINGESIHKKTGEKYYINAHNRLSDNQSEKMEKKYNKVIDKKIREKLDKEAKNRMKDINIEISSGHEVVSFTDGEDKVVFEFNYSHNRLNITENGGRGFTEDMARLEDMYYATVVNELEKYKEEHKQEDGE